MRPKQNIEYLVLYMVCFTFLFIIICLIVFMGFNGILDNLDSNLISAAATFFGSLFGAGLSGLVAISIMRKQMDDNIRTTHMSKYGSMKYLALELNIFPFHVEYIENILKACEEDSRMFEAIKEFIPIEKLKKLKLQLEKERYNIPDDFVSRYYTVLNTLEYVIVALERYINHPSEQNISFLKSHMEESVRICDRFKHHAFQYVSEVEHQYNIKDYY